jgi:ubiquinone biosynthesis protein COQ4
MCGLATLAGSLRLKGEKRRLLHTVYIPWGLKAGMQCAPLLCIRYEDHFEEDLEELRARWRIVVAPPISAGYENRNKKESASE